MLEKTLFSKTVIGKYGKEVNDSERLVYYFFLRSRILNLFSFFLKVYEFGNVSKFSILPDIRF